MNKIVRFSLIIVAASLLGACCSTRPVNCGSVQDTFHINMGLGDHGPDVKNWQCFLLAKGFCHIIPDGTFKEDTKDATVRFKSRFVIGST